jgi:hypothetical protein
MQPSARRHVLAALRARGAAWNSWGQPTHSLRRGRASLHCRDAACLKSLLAGRLASSLKPTGALPTSCAAQASLGGQGETPAATHDVLHSPQRIAGQSLKRAVAAAHVSPREPDKHAHRDGGCEIRSTPGGQHLSSMSRPVALLHSREVTFRREREDVCPAAAPTM